MKLELRVWIDGIEIDLGPHFKRQALGWLKLGEQVARAESLRRLRGKKPRRPKGQTAADLHQ